MRCVFLDRASVDTGDLDLQALREMCSSLQLYEQTEGDQVIERIQGADVVLTNKVKINADHLQQASQLKLICVTATGTNNVDLDAAKIAGVVVSNIRAYATASVVQHVFAVMLALFTQLNRYQEMVARGQWQQSRVFCPLEYPIYEIQGKVLGIFGYGELGKGVAQVAKAFGMQVLVAQPTHKQDLPTGRVPLAQLLSEVDVLSIHCPLTPATRNLIGAAQLARMKPSAMLINTARGGIVNESALAAALRSGRLAGAAVDVLSEEPPVNGNPLLEPDIPNLILTPHTAWAAREARQRAVDQVVGNIKAFQAGSPANRVA